MARPAFLEAFEVLDGGAPSAPSDDWIAGHAAGLAEATANLQTDQTLLTRELVQTLSDMAFGYREAMAHLTASLGPLFQQLLENFVPEFARVTLVPTLVEALVEAAAFDLGAPISLAVSPDQHATVAKAVAGMQTLQLYLTADPSLASGQAVLTHKHGEVLIDFDSLIVQSQQILAALLDTQTQRSDHG